MGQRRKVGYWCVVKYAKRHPEAVQSEIGEHFGISQSRVSYILRSAGQSNTHRDRGRRSKANPNEWEKQLSNLGLGMDRGLRLHGKRILYGYDPVKQTTNDDSVTHDCN